MENCMCVFLCAVDQAAVGTQRMMFSVLSLLTNAISTVDIYLTDEQPRCHITGLTGQLAPGIMLW